MSNDQQENYDEAGYWDDNGEYQYYQQQYMVIIQRQ